MTTDDLKRLRLAANDAINEARSGEYFEPINWGDLGCVEAAEIRTDDGSVRYRVLIEEAAPECPGFCAAVAKRLRPEWGDVEVVTEW